MHTDRTKRATGKTYEHSYASSHLATAKPLREAEARPKRKPSTLPGFLRLVPLPPPDGFEEPPLEALEQSRLLHDGQARTEREAQRPLPVRDARQDGRQVEPRLCGPEYGIPVPTISKELLKAAIEATHRRGKLALVDIGSLEGAHRHVLQTRLKRAGQRWGLIRARRMARLRAFYRTAGAFHFHRAIRDALAPPAPASTHTPLPNAPRRVKHASKLSTLSPLNRRVLASQ